MKEKPMLTIFNNHLVSCGIPPDLTAKGTKGELFISYFEGNYGEQFIFVGIRNVIKSEAYVLSGDAGWEKKYEVHFGTANDLITGTFESLWIYACWKSYMDHIESWNLSRMIKKAGG
jgi:hypothetical protein